ncbi:hypothetical protein [Sulfurovum sp.]|jgi:hypothetical protein|uniref:hypothetical protein n=1 Tax=Sulfurovum sp. TaxID=1969726 RepID=UPI002A36B5DD|nr:hypothetical protein [Sulfurovum sp.]MDY0401985.1 hypothetical protein [Sulfurovum sp.]
MKYLLLAAMLLLGGCSSKDTRAQRHWQDYKRYYPVIINAERRATPPAKKVLRTARSMVVNGEIVRGACWDYLNKACQRSGYAYPDLARVFTATPKGPYAPAYLLQPGDWLYFMNHSYYNVEHSGMFIAWIDRGRNIALILSYAGEHRREPARYKPYDISHTYTILRAVD